MSLWKRSGTRPYQSSSPTRRRSKPQSRRLLALPGQAVRIAGIVPGNAVGAVLETARRELQEVRIAGIVHGNGGAFGGAGASSGETAPQYARPQAAAPGRILRAAGDVPIPELAGFGAAGKPAAPGHARESVRTARAKCGGHAIPPGGAPRRRHGRGAARPGTWRTPQAGMAGAKTWAKPPARRQAPAASGTTGRGGGDADETVRRPGHRTPPARTRTGRYTPHDSIPITECAALTPCLS